MKASEMSNKTKEKHADYLLKFSSNMLTAFFITVLITPLGIFLTNFIKNTNLINILSNFSYWEGIIFIIIETVMLYLAIEFQDKAYTIYNALNEG